MDRTESTEELRMEVTEGKKDVPRSAPSPAQPPDQVQGQDQDEVSRPHHDVDGLWRERPVPILSFGSFSMRCIIM